MRQRTALVSLLGASLLLLVSLYLPWQEPSFAHARFFGGQSSPVITLPNLLVSTLSIDGWSSSVGFAAALAALALAGAAILAAVRPALVDCVPLGVAALAAGYFAVAVTVQTRSAADAQHVFLGIGFHTAYGTYVGVAGAIAAVSSAAAVRWAGRPLVRPWPAIDASLVLVLLVAVLLPWAHARVPRGEIGLSGMDDPRAAVAALLALCVVALSWRRPSVDRLVVAAATLLFVAAAVGSSTFPGHNAYAAWLALGAAIALVGSQLAGVVVAHVTLQRPSPSALATAAAASLVVVSLFLPWQTACSRSGPGRCTSTDGWFGTLGSTEALLAIALVVAVLGLRRIVVVSAAEIASGLGLLVATAGLQLIDRGGPGVELGYGYGAILGFVAAAVALLFVVGSAVRQPTPQMHWPRIAWRLLALAACVAYLFVAVVPWWLVLSTRLEADLGFAPLSWLTLAGVLVGLRLVGAWERRVGGLPVSADWLVGLPLGLLALAAVDLVRLRDGGLTWGGGMAVALSAALALFGYVEGRGGLAGLRVPAILRVDRL